MIMLIGAALSAVGAIAGGIASSAAARKQRKMIKDARAQNKRDFERAYNEDFTQRADALRMLNMTEESVKNRSKQAEARQAVTGGTDEQVAAAREANNEALSDTMSSLAAANAQRKDTLRDKFESRDADYAQQLGQIEGQRAQSIGRATGALSSIAGSMDLGEIKLKNGKTLNL